MQVEVDYNGIWGLQPTLEWNFSFHAIFFPLSTEPYSNDSVLSPCKIPGMMLCNPHYRTQLNLQKLQRPHMHKPRKLILKRLSFSFSWALIVLPCDSHRSPSIPNLIRDNPNLHKNDILLLLGDQDISTWLQRENCNKHVIWQSKTISSNQTKTKHNKKWVWS